MKKVIYILRMQCEECNLDKMISFYRVKNGIISEMYKGHKDHAKQTWPDKHGCTHKVKFTQETEMEYRWDTDTNQAVKI